MTGVAVQRVEETAHLVAPIVLAFSADPFVRWMLPGPSKFLTYCSALTRLHGKRTAAHGGAYSTSDGRGAAFWYPAGVHPDGQALEEIFAEAGILDRVSAVWERAAAFEPVDPHWYLRQIGVDPAVQRGGHGSALLAAGLAEVDRHGQPAYLEATSPAGRAFYERHGFTALGEVRVADSAPLWPMLRAARGVPPA